MGASQGEKQLQMNQKNCLHGAASPEAWLLLVSAQQMALGKPCLPALGLSSPLKNGSQSPSHR